MATKSPEATIDFLLMCLECTEGKTDWEKVAIKTGWYKGGKFSKQAFVGIQKKYGGIEIGGVKSANGIEAEKAKKVNGKKRVAAKDEEAGKGRNKKTKKEDDAAEDGDADEIGGVINA